VCVPSQRNNFLAYGKAYLLFVRSLLFIFLLYFNLRKNKNPLHKHSDVDMKKHIWYEHC
jgi:hypothetical protein